MRYASIDIARALAVIGVVYSHAVDGLLNARVIDTHGALVAINEVLYLVRMPALAFTLGLFVFSGVAKRGQVGYIRARATLAVYLYLIWFFLQTTVEVLASGLKNHATEPVALLQIWSPPAQLWFLSFLVVSTVVCALLVPVLERHAMTILAISACVSIVLWQWNPNIVGARGLSLLAFTLTGAVVGHHRLGASLERRPSAWLGMAAVAGLGYIALAPVGLRSGTARTALDLSAIEFSGANVASLAASVLGVVMLLGVAVLLSHLTKGRRALTHIGQRTLEIYLAHVIVVAGARIILMRLGVDNQWLLITVLVALGVVVPLVLTDRSRQLHVAWLFRLPTRLARWADRPKRTSAVA